MEFSLKSFFQDVNASKFVVYSSILVFAILLALREDGSLQSPYWAVFLPLFVWKLFAIVGGVVGAVVHWRNPPQRNDLISELEYRSMVVCVGEHLLLLMFEALACYKLETKSTNLLWLLVFVPLLFHSFVSILICIWAVRREKSFEFELFFSVNILQFVFVALKLDKMVTWSWVIILIPLWILICVSLIGVLYAIVLAVLLLRSIELLPEHRRQHVYTAIGYTFLVVPILVFLVLLTSKLDGDSRVPFVIVCTPLYISLVCLILMACGTRGGNQWWFGIRRDFCLFLLDSCPCLQEYGNVSYKVGERSAWRSEATDGTDCGRPLNGASAAREMKPVCPVVSIEVPD